MAEDHDSTKAKDINSLSSVSSSITDGKTPRLKVSRYSLTGEPDDGKLSSPVQREGNDTPEFFFRNHVLDPTAVCFGVWQWNVGSIPTMRATKPKR